MSGKIKYLLFVLLLINLVQIVQVSRNHVTYPGIGPLSSTTLHLSTLGSINRRGFILPDPIYMNEYNYYPWLHQLMQVIVSRTTFVPPGIVYTYWPAFQVFFLVVGAYGVGKALISDNGGVWVVLLALIVRSTKRVMFLSWPLYTSFAHIYFLILFLAFFLIRKRPIFLFLAGRFSGYFFGD